jgi:VIT1/CCC1 family predicted Fe2+/Mn2+ transporter
VRGSLIGVVIIMTVIGVTTHEFMEWKTAESERRDAVCKTAQQHMETLEIQARAMAAGLSVEGYAEAEKAEVGKLVSALDTATNDAEVEAVIDAHAAELKTQDAATDAELKNQGSQQFLEQQLKKQRIPTDIKQEIKRAEKAVSDACI